MTEAATAVRLRITEIFHSLQGEARTVGWPTVFVRLTGCPLRCHYCDTAYAFHGGETRSLPEILATVQGYGSRHVTVTGGEPLAQRKGCHALLQALVDAGHEVSLETSGAMDIDGIDPRVSRVVDIKTPGSGEQARNRWENLELLNGNDQVKFVICDRADYEWARQVIADHRLAERCEVLISPSFGQVAARDLADWVVADALPVRFQLQLHKLVWGDEPGR
ncbi:7-carboxy-7-deazaguanine synthase QueE [Aquisalimonas lutea]|uniref:7-carboxy-7-deazaguanine synthase QueE n=1 Tax=Aquisalimonas lutea TaxID=1327750 RepID=UPI0025B38FF8|nr:7-carboxy-7-deazaguanine synthase QueE [Aquisalimonas lutea]MDN3517070.1 7-carboxy-7-deazaguanine synthase QueE [Aquisalimonas lutea]